MDGLDKVLTELKAQGRNLNQLTTLANRGKSTMVYGDRLAESYQPVSYTHLDVYKRQLQGLLPEVGQQHVRPLQQLHHGLLPALCTQIRCV